MRGPQNNAWRLAGFKSLLPTRGTQTPAIAWLQAGKAELPHRRRQIITARFRIRKKLRRHYGTDGVAADVFLARIAAAVAIETCHGLERTDFQRLAEHIPGWNWSWLFRNVLPEVSKRSSFGLVALRSLFSGLARPSSRPWSDCRPACVAPSLRQLVAASSSGNGLLPSWP
jgi:hypothetical protein